MKQDILHQVACAQASPQATEDLIRAYLPFIRSEASKFLGRFCTDQDDEYSIAMIAFHEAIQGFSPDRGAFTSYAATVIRSRLIDYQRKEARHQGHLSLDEPEGDDLPARREQLADSRDAFEEAANLEATQQEIAELAQVMAAFGVSFRDVAENSPKQGRTLEACTRAIRCGGENKELLAELLNTKKLPLAQLVLESGVERKTLERHRKYILAMLLIQTNGYEIIRGHLRHILQKKGGVTK